MWLILLTLMFPQQELDNTFKRLQNRERQLVRSLAAGINPAKGVDPAKSAKIQYRLLQEELVWRNWGYSSRQVTIVSMLAFYKGIGLFEKQIEEIGRPPDEKQTEWILETTQFIEEVKKIVGKDFKELGEISDRELRLPHT